MEHMGIDDPRMAQPGAELRDHTKAATSAAREKRSRQRMYLENPIGIG